MGASAPGILWNPCVLPGWLMNVLGKYVYVLICWMGTSWKGFWGGNVLGFSVLPSSKWIIVDMSSMCAISFPSSSSSLALLNLSFEMISPLLLFIYQLVMANGSDKLLNRSKFPRLKVEIIKSF